MSWDEATGRLGDTAIRIDALEGNVRDIGVGLIVISFADDMGLGWLVERGAAWAAGRSYANEKIVLRFPTTKAAVLQIPPNLAEATRFDMLMTPAVLRGLWDVGCAPAATECQYRMVGAWDEWRRKWTQKGRVIAVGLVDSRYCNALTAAPIILRECGILGRGEEISIGQSRPQKF